MQKIYIFIFITTSLFAFPHFSKAQKEKYLYPLGEKVYKKWCRDINYKAFSTIDALYTHIEKICRLDEKRYNIALACYLWDGVKKERHEVVFEYSKKDKCPVCGMFVYKYPKWVSMAILESGERVYFDGVKDMMKYYLPSKDHVKALYGQDYYSKKIFDLGKGYFVIGSDVHGAMGSELIPFKNKEDAQSFLHQHRGKKMVQLQDIDLKTLEALDE